MTTEILGLENTAKGGASGPFTGLHEMLNVAHGDFVEIGLSTAILLKSIHDRGAGVVRVASPGERVIRAPQAVRTALTGADFLASPHDRALHATRGAALHAELGILPEGHATWQQYSAHLFAEEKNSLWRAELTKARAALAELQAELGKAQERKLAQAEADAAAARTELEKVRATKLRPTQEKLVEDLEQAQLQVETFERAGVESSKLERAKKRLEIAQKAMANSERAELGDKARAFLEAELSKYDTAATKLAALAQPHVEAAQAALQAGDFEGVLFFAQRIREALAPQVEVTRETRPGMYGNSASHGPGAQSKLGPPLH